MFLENFVKPEKPVDQAKMVNVACFQADHTTRRFKNLDRDTPHLESHLEPKFSTLQLKDAGDQRLV